MLVLSNIIHRQMDTGLTGIVKLRRLKSKRLRRKKKRRRKNLTLSRNSCTMTRTATKGLTSVRH